MAIKNYNQIFSWWIYPDTQESIQIGMFLNSLVILIQFENSDTSFHVHAGTAMIFSPTIRMPIETLLLKLILFKIYYMNIA